MRIKFLLFSILSCCWLSTITAQRVDLKKGLMAQYLFNGSAEDASSNKNDGMEFGGLEYVKDRFGNKCGALHFNGSNGYVTVPNSRSLSSPEDQLSVAVWFKLEPESSGLKWLTVCCKSNSKPETISSPQYRCQATRVTVSINTDFTENIKKDFPYNEWHHYVLVYDGNYVKAYLDGVKYFYFPYSKPFTPNNSALDIGRDVPGELEFFKGAFDDLRIYNRGLSEAEIKAIYKDESERTSPKPCQPSQPPVVTITTPQNNPHKTKQSTQKIEAKIEYVDNKKDVTFLVNGQKVKQFNFNPKSKTFTATIDLINGGNNVKIIGKNSAGEDSDTRTIIYQQKKLPPPIVTIKIPNDNPHTTTQSTQRIMATIENVNNQSDVTFEVNGRSENFKFNSSSQIFQANIQLQKGSNQFTITGKNTVGKDKGTGVIIYKKESLPPPIVSIQVPSNNPHRTKIGTQRITARIKNVNSQSDVTFTVNGQSASFKFNPSTESFQAEINLMEGGNIVKITGKNTVGEDDADVMIIYEKEKLPPPIVTITTPKKSPYNTKSGREDIIATIKNVRSKSDVTFRVNGSRSTNFNFDSNTEKFAASIDLIEGGNVVEIEGKNTVGKDDATTMIIYKKKEEIKKPPTVEITMPSQSPATTLGSRREVIATTTNVSSKRDIDFRVNGDAITAFSFDPTTQTIKSNVNLIIGANQIDIYVKNKDGKADDNTVIIRREKRPTPVDSLNVRFTETVTVKQDQIVFKCYDHQREDGDIVSVWMDDELIVDKLKLKVLGNGEFSTVLELEEGRVYSIIPKAWNLGTKPPNTMAIEINDGISPVVEIILESEIGESEAIKLVYKK
ncbi:MAG: LamG-like jellyroll fold domain-containing protein [Saprospiraceae bacterium]